MCSTRKDIAMNFMKCLQWEATLSLGTGHLLRGGGGGVVHDVASQFQQAHETIGWQRRTRGGGLQNGRGGGI